MAKNNGSINLKNKPVASTLNDKSTDIIGTYYLADNPHYYEPQRSNTFKFVVSGLDNFIDLGEYGNITTDESAEKALELSVKASSVPHFSINRVSITRGNSDMHFAGKPTFSEGSLSVRDYIGAHTKEILMAWQNQAYNVRTQKVGLAKDYKRTATLYELTPDYQIVREWTLYGCWVTDISEPNFDHDSADVRVMDVKISYDYAQLEPNDAE